MTHPRTPPHFLTLVFLTALSTLSLNMFLPSLANIASDLDVEYATVSFAVAGYLAVTVVIQICAGPLSDRVGRRPVLLVALSLFVIASIGCSIAENIWTFLSLRMIQGGIISGYALSLAIVRDTTSERKAAGLIGYISMAMAIAPMVGPMVGGVLDTAFGWRANFYFYAVLGGLLLIWCWIDLGETKPADTRQTNENPETVRTLLRERKYWAYSLCSACSTGAFYIFLTGAPLIAAAEFGVSTAKLGFYIGTITAGFMFGSFLSGRFAPQFHPTTMMLAGRLLACGGLSLGLILMFAGYVTPFVFFGSTICVGIGNGLTMPSSNASAMSVRPNLSGSAAGLTGAMVVGIGAVLTTLTGNLVPLVGGPFVLHLLMLATSAGGLVAVLWAKRLLDD